MEDKIPLEEAVFLMHYGRGHLDGGHSGRYPYGSGDDPYQHSQDFITTYKNYVSEGLTEVEIAEKLGMSTTTLRTQYSLAVNAQKARDKANAREMFEKGDSYTEIAKKLGKPESTVRGWLKEQDAVKAATPRETADMIKREAEKKGWLDVGEGVERELGVSKERMKAALAILEEEGFTTHKVSIEQATNKGNRTRMVVLTPDDTSTAEVYNHPENINSYIDYTSDDGGETFRPKFVYPASMDSSRLYIRYPDEGGNTKDGVIQIRRGVKDLSLGESHYAQVRILVDGTHYMKGMAIYADDDAFPSDDVDVIFNTSKSREDHPGLKALKEIKYKDEKNKIPADNPFKSLIKSGIVDPDDPSSGNGGQSYYIDDDGKKKLSLINKKAEEGDWSNWSDNLPSQFLSKQSKELIKKQLDISKADKQEEFDSIMELTNPVVKSELLKDFAGACDTNSVSLKAAALPRQKYQVILPVDGLKETEVYAPGYRDGETVALVRFPHEGTFAIPVLKVNNKNPDAVKNLGQLTDAVGINAAVAERLSGADFDGDTVMVIPCNSNTSKVKVTSTKRLRDLIGFDNKMEYSYSEDEIKKGKFVRKVDELRKEGKTDKEIADNYDISEKELKEQYKEAKNAHVSLMRDTQKEMGVISNLITDMTLKGASEDELARAVKHSMVVIDAEKHGLDYKRSEAENKIQELKDEYQAHMGDDGKIHYGASTLISRAKSEVRIDKRQGSERVNIEGKPWYDPTQPEGSVSRKVADDNKLYYAEGTYDKKTGIATYKTVDGRKVIFNKNDREESAKYAPRMVKSSTGDISFVNSVGDIFRVGKRKDTITAMEATNDARTLSTGTVQEAMYADYANFLKNLANKARVEAEKCGTVKVNATAKQTYAKEREHLLAQLHLAQMNAPRERMAQAKTNAEMAIAERDDDSMSDSLRKKRAQQLLTKNRALFGAKGTKITINDREWEAIQAGAISATDLKSIMEKAEPGRIKQLATPRGKTTTLSTGKKQKINAMRASGHYTVQEIADSLGVSVTTIRNYLKGAL